tara:strand:+ start:322 stop:429 length:108 start_codon:yes stop_codon:yes gene_type:complete
MNKGVAPSSFEDIQLIRTTTTTLRIKEAATTRTEQ